MTDSVSPSSYSPGPYEGIFLISCPVSEPSS